MTEQQLLLLKRQRIIFLTSTYKDSPWIPLAEIEHKPVIGRECWFDNYGRIWDTSDQALNFYDIINKIDTEIQDLLMENDLYKY